MTGFSPGLAEDDVPVIGHISDRELLWKDGELTTTIEVDGASWELVDPATRNAQARALAACFRDLADPRITVYAHAVMGQAPELPPAGRLETPFADSLASGLRERLSDTRQLRWFVTVSVSPRRSRRLLDSIMRRHRPPTTDQALRVRLKEAISILSHGLAHLSPRVLGLRQEGNGFHSEPAEALYAVRTARSRKIGLPNGPLGSVIAADRIVVEVPRRRFRLHRAGEIRYGACLGLLEYPDRTWPGTLNGLLSAGCDLTITQSFRPLSRPQALALLDRRERQGRTVEDKALSQQQGLVELQDDVASGRASMGEHHLVVTVFAASPRELDHAVGKVDRLLSDAGAHPAIEDIGLDAAIRSTMPSNAQWRTRPGAITNVNFSHLASLEGYPDGDV